MISVLLGNGFSQAWDPHIFNYRTLFETADFGDRSDILRSLFDRLETYDFESVMKQLLAAEVVLELYEVNQSIIEQVQDDKMFLRNALINAISNNHPNLPTNVNVNQYIAVRRFLSQFDKVFTVNYDLLLYWARNQSELEPIGYSTDDGFRNDEWHEYGTVQNVYFLHGGLHLYDLNGKIKKHCFNADGISIIEQVRDNLEQDKFPLFISEPTHEKKKNKIEHNPYLNFCFQALRELSGTLFVYGHSIADTDRHIFKQIKHSSINKVFVSIYGDENSEQNTQAIANARAFLGNRITVEFYVAENSHVWT